MGSDRELDSFDLGSLRSCKFRTQYRNLNLLIDAISKLINNLESLCDEFFDTVHIIE